jgi:Uncharacterized protein conserved in bacteria
MRFILMGLAWLAVAIGVVGIFVPVLPTTPFIILAAALFARSSPRFEQWLLDHPRLGKPLTDWRRDGAISRSAKIASVSMMTVSYGVLWFAGSQSPYVRLIVALILVSCAVYVLSRPEPT